MPRDKNNEEQKQGSPAWMTTFGDMMTLLLVFFVLLYSFSVLDLEKFRGFISSFQNKVGVLDGGKSLSEGDRLNQGMQGDRYNPARHNMSQIMGEMDEFVREKGLEKQVSMEMTSRGLVIRFAGEVLFDLGRAEIKPGGEELLVEVAEQIKEVPNNIAVEGHTDNLPIRNERFPSNWELSTTRATNVIKFMIEEYDIDPLRLSAAGYSEYRPLVDNDSPENRAQNRRVEIVVKDSTTQETQEGG